MQRNWPKYGLKAATQIATQGAKKAAKSSADDVFKATGDDIIQAGTKGVGKATIIVNVAFMIWDAIDLSYTIKDLIEDKGSAAAKLLREKADELQGFAK